MIRAYLGGSFDPVHLAHLQMAMNVWSDLNELTNSFTVALLPTSGNPFKKNPTDNQHRIEMLKRSIDQLPLCIEYCELNKKPPVYTIDTVLQLHQRHPKDELIFIIGQDSLNSLHLWKDAFELIKAVKFWVFPRFNEKYHLQIPLKKYQDLPSFLLAKHGFYLDNRSIAAMSSSQIRKLYLDGRADATKSLLPLSVYEYIRTHQLYQD